MAGLPFYRVSVYGWFIVLRNTCHTFSAIFSLHCCSQVATSVMFISDSLLNKIP